MSGSGPGRKRSGEKEGLTLGEYALTAGELGAAAGQTVLVALLPVLIRKYASSTFLIGFAVGGEGLFALALPFVIGLMSDHLPQGLAHRFGRRSFFLLIAAPVMGATLGLLPFLSGYWLMTGVAFLFFAGLHTYMTPLMALMVDTVPDRKRARVQAVRSVYRAIGLAYGLVAAGLLFSIWKPLPFLLCGVLIALSTVATYWAERAIGEDRGSGEGRSILGAIKNMWTEIRENRAASWLLAANALWNGAVDGIRPYFFLFATAVIGVSVATTSIGLIALVVSIGVSSVVLGKLGDEHDRGRLLEYGVALAVAAMLGGFFVRGPWSAVVMLLIAGVGAAAMMTLPYPLFASLMGEEEKGQYSGLFVITVSVGRIFAPMLVGAAVDLGRSFMPTYKGYPFMWLAAAVLAALGWLALWRTKTNKARQESSDDDAGGRKSRTSKEQSG